MLSSCAGRNKHATATEGLQIIRSGHPEQDEWGGRTRRREGRGEGNLLQQAAPLPPSHGVEIVLLEVLPPHEQLVERPVDPRGIIWCKLQYSRRSQGLRLQGGAH